MKKRKLKSLKLNKKSISNLDNCLGGQPPKSFFKSDCDNTTCPSELNECITETLAANECLPSLPHTDC